jgi:hypothetical protein
MVLMTGFCAEIKIATKRIAYVGATFILNETLNCTEFRLNFLNIRIIFNVC